MTDVLRDIAHGCLELSQSRDSWVLYNPHNSLRRSCCSRTSPRAQSVKGGDGICTQVARLHSTAHGLVILLMRVVRSARASKGFGEADYTPSPNTTNHHHGTQLSARWRRWGPQGPLQLVPAAGVGPVAGPRTSMGAFPGRLWSRPACAPLPRTRPHPSWLPWRPRSAWHPGGTVTKECGAGLAPDTREVGGGRNSRGGVEGSRRSGGEGTSPLGPKNRVGGRPLH